MIIVKILGGLGNQLFQYAFGYVVAKRLGSELKLDALDFDVKYRLRNFELKNFNILFNLASEEEVKQYCNLPQKVLAKVNEKTPLKFKTKYIKERTYRFDPVLISSLVDGAYYNGYWQSYKYFESHKCDLLKEFSFRLNPDPINEKLLEEIEKTNSVSIHIRRTDYLTNAASSKIYHLCSLDYYQQAIKYLNTKFEDLNFFIFSDDIDWVKSNFQISNPCVYISHNKSDKSYEDLRLMAACKHNIIANSTFSWWGAYLNSNPEKVVIAPLKWFKNGHNTEELLPSEWIKL